MRKLHWLIIAVAVAALFVAAVSCGRGHKIALPGTERLGTPGGGGIGGAETPEDSAPARTALTVMSPSLAGAGAGFEFDVKIRLANSGDVFQGCGRLVYDSSCVRPVGASRGTFLPADAVSLVKTDVHGYIPFAFTGREGAENLPAGEGEIYVIRFRLTNPPAEGDEPPRFSLLNEAEFLQLRNNEGRRVQFDLATEVTAR